MTWFKLDDNFPDNPKVAGLTDAAFRLHVTAGCYASRLETDGKVLKAIVARLTGKKTAPLINELIDQNLWHDLGDCYELHDFLEYNPSKAELDSKRKAKSMAGAMGAAKRWASVSHDTPNAPDPTRPIDQEHTSGPKAEPFSDDFAAWWAEYPRKDGKQKAKAAYTARRRAGVDADTLLVAVRGYAAGVVGTELKFVKTPAVFLHGAEGPWSEVTPVVGFSPALDADDRAREPRRCPTCANTGNYFVNGVMTRCGHDALRSA